MTYDIVDNVIAIPSPSLKPPWDYRDGVSYIAVPYEHRVTRPETGAVVDRDEQVRVLTSNGAVMTTEQLADAGLRVDANWSGEYVDCAVEGFNTIKNETAEAIDIHDLYLRSRANLLHFIDLPSIGEMAPDVTAGLLALWSMSTFAMPVWGAYGYLHFDALGEEYRVPSRAAGVMQRMSFWLDHPVGRQHAS